MIAEHIPSAEERRLTIQAALDGARSSANRNRLGQFATPNKLAIEIARYVAALSQENESRVRFADPSIGTGSFFSAALATFGSDRISSAVGVELDPTYANAARDLWAGAGLEVVSGDFTRIVAGDACPPAPNLILANPPYVRHHHLDTREKERLRGLVRQLTGVEVNGLSGLYVYFLLLATAWMADGGCAAWLVPSEFMDVNYGTALKNFLIDRVTLLRAHRFDPDDVQFGDALVSSAVLVFRKAPPPRDHAPEFTHGGSLTEPRAGDRVPLERLRESRKWTAYPSHDGNDRRSVSSENTPKLADLFRIRRGIATGGNKFFILERSVSESLKLPEEHLKPILPSPRHLKTTVVEADNRGYPVINPQLCVIDCNLPEYLVEQRYPSLWNYLQTANALEVKKSYLVSKRSPWYKQEQREPAPILCTYMGRGVGDKQPFRFILNRSNAIAGNLYLMLHPLSGLARMLREHPERLASIHEHLARITGNELRGEGRVYGGGLNKIEPSELGRVSAAPLVEQWPELGESVQRAQPRLLFE